MKNEKVNWPIAIKIAGSIISISIGAGFSSGQEALQFFVSYGTKGAMGAILMSFISFTIIAVIVAEFGRKARPEDLNSFFSLHLGRKVGTLLDWFTVIYLYGICLVMISGSGASMHQYFGWNSMVGSLIMATVCCITALFGLKRLVDIIGAIGPVLIVMTIAIGGYCLAINSGNLANADTVLASQSFLSVSSSWFVSGLLYACFQLFILAGTIPSIGAMSPNKKTTMVASIGGMAVFHIALAVLVYAMFANLDILGGTMVPTIALATSMHPVIAFAFSAVIILAIYSSACPELWTPAARFFGDEKSTKFRIGTVVLAIGGFIVSYLFPLDVLINFIYGLTGYLGIALLAAVLISEVIYRKKNPAGTGYLFENQ